MPSRLCFKLFGGDVTLLALLCREIETDDRIDSCALTNLTTHTTQVVDPLRTVNIQIGNGIDSTDEAHVNYMMLLVKKEVSCGNAVCTFIVPAIQRLKAMLTCHVIE